MSTPDFPQAPVVYGMRAVVVCSLLLALFSLIDSSALARNKFKTLSKSRYRPDSSPVNVQDSRLKLNTLLGVNVVNSAAFLIGGQLGLRTSSEKALFVGPEITLTLDAPASLLMVLAGGWYEHRFQEGPGLGLVVGAVAGLSVSDRFHDLARHSAVFFLDSAIVKDLDEYVSLRAQLRPGTIGGRLAVLMNFNVCFSF